MPHDAHKSTKIDKLRMAIAFKPLSLVISFINLNWNTDGLNKRIIYFFNTPILYSYVIKRYIKEVPSS